MNYLSTEIFKRNLNNLNNNNKNGNCPSGRSSPIFSWSPLPQRKEINFKKHLNKNLSEKEKYYLNCDVNVWLRSCEEEILQPLDGEIKGEIPTWLNGTLLRNGPGSLKAGDDYFEHLFDSSAFLHRFAINKGSVTYQGRFIQTENYKKNRAANRIVSTEFGTKAIPDPCHTIFEKISSVFNIKSDLPDNSLISVYPFNDEIYAFNEGPIIHKINSETLETEGKLDVSKYIAIVNHTSHPHIMKDGTVYNTGLSIHPTGPYHNIICFPPNQNDCDSSETMFERAQIIASVPTRWPLQPSYMHTFGITENYFILVEQPLNVSVSAAISTKFNNDPFIGCFRWYHDEQTQIDVIDRKTGTLTHKFYADAFFYLHIINQYEMNDYIILDICMYRDPAMLECMYIDVMKTMHQNPDYAKMFRGRPARFILPLNPGPVKLDNTNLIKLANTKAMAYFLKSGEIFVKPEKLCDLGCETPRINYDNYLGKPYRFFYAISSDVDADNPGTIIKVDTLTKSAKTWCEFNCYPSEPIFVPNPKSKFEDDGIVLSAMVWGFDDTNHVGLLILDARTFTEIGRAEFRTPGPVPKCLHGWFIPQKNFI